MSSLSIRRLLNSEFRLHMLASEGPDGSYLLSLLSLWRLKWWQLIARATAHASKRSPSFYFRQSLHPVSPQPLFNTILHSFRSETVQSETSNKRQVFIAPNFTLSIFLLVISPFITLNYRLTVFERWTPSPSRSPFKQRFFASWWEFTFFPLFFPFIRQV